MKKVFLLLMCMGLANLTVGERVWAYSSLFDATADDFNNFYGNNLSFNIVEVIDGRDSKKGWDKYYGYTGDDYSGYYIGTISGNDASNKFAPFLDIIKYYLDDKFFSSFTQLKVGYEDYEGLEQGSSEDKGITLTVTFDEFKDKEENEPISGEGVLNFV